MYNKVYDKKLIILKQDTMGYSANKGTLTGTVTVEIRNGKGKLSLSTKGLKTLTTDKYKAFAVSCDKVAELGNIELNKNNESILKIEFNPDNFLGSNTPIDEYKVFVVSMNENKEITPLVGFYNDEKQNFKHILLKSNIIKEQPPSTKKPDTTLVSTRPLEKSTIPKPREIEQEKKDTTNEPSDDEDGIKLYPVFDMGDVDKLTDQPVNFATARDFFNDFSVNDKDIKTPDNIKEDIDKAYETLNSMLSHDKAKIEKPNKRHSYTDDNRHDEIPSFSNILKENNEKFESLQKTPCLTPDEIKKYDIKVEALSVKTNGGITEMYKHNPKLNPFPSLKGVEWIRISDAELVFLPIPLFKYMNHPFLATAYEEYKHYALGRCTETGNLYLGIPYLYKTVDKEMADSLKFSRFKCINDKMLTEESYGYWIMDMN